MIKRTSYVRVDCRFGGKATDKGRSVVLGRIDMCHVQRELESNVQTRLRQTIRASELELSHFLIINK